MAFLHRRAFVALASAAALTGCGGVVYRGGEYLGTTEVTRDGQMIGLPEGVPLTLYVGLQENVGWGSAISHQSVPVPITVRPGQRYALVTEFGKAGFAWDLKRI